MIKVKTTFESENGLPSLKQTGGGSFSRGLWDPLGMEERAAASPCLICFGRLGGCVLGCEDTPRLDRNQLEGFLSSICPWKDLVLCERRQL